MKKHTSRIYSFERLCQDEETDHVPSITHIYSCMHHAGDTGSIENVCHVEDDSSLISDVTNICHNDDTCHVSGITNAYHIDCACHIYNIDCLCHDGDTCSIVGLYQDCYTGH